MNDVFFDDDPYLADFIGPESGKERESDVPQRILHPLHVRDIVNQEGAPEPVYEWGIVANLQEAQLPFMDLTWVASKDGWMANDWNQYFNHSRKQLEELGLPTAFLIVPGVSASIADWEAKYGNK